MNEHHDEYYYELETREPDHRAEVQFQDLRSLLAWALTEAPGLAAHLKGVEVGEVTDRAALASFPFSASPT